MLTSASSKLSYSERANDIHKRNDIIWSKVEGAIRDIDSDVLLIFDCCHAGRLGTRTRGAQHNNFEFLGSCGAEQLTRSPGKESFTQALIWALSELAPSDAPFDTVKLLAKIVKHEGFPHDQVPCLAFRDHPSNEHVVIARKSLVDAAKVPTREAKQEEMEHKESIDIRLHFDSFVDEKVIVATATELKRLIDDRTNDFHVKDIAFKGKVSLLERTASEFVKKARNASMDKMVLVPPGIATVRTDLSASANAILTLTPDLDDDNHPWETAGVEGDRLIKQKKSRDEKSMHSKEA